MAPHPLSGDFYYLVDVSCYVITVMSTNRCVKGKYQFRKVATYTTISDIMDVYITLV